VPTADDPPRTWQNACDRRAMLWFGDSVTPGAPTSLKDGKSLGRSYPIVIADEMIRPSRPVHHQRPS
jgi:hypothetical protein